MSTKKVDDYAFRYGISNSEAKRRIGRRRHDDSNGAYSQARAAGTVAGVGSKGARRRQSGK